MEQEPDLVDPRALQSTVFLPPKGYNHEPMTQTCSSIGQTDFQAGRDLGGVFLQGEGQCGALAAFPSTTLGWPGYKQPKRCNHVTNQRSLQLISGALTAGGGLVSTGDLKLNGTGMEPATRS